MRPATAILAATLLTSFQTAAQADVANDMTAASLAACAEAKTGGYETRMRAVFAETDARFLRTLNDNAVIVCLDTRLGSQAGDKHNQTMVSGYYNTGGQKILSLYDTGSNTRRGGWLDGNVHTYGERSLRGFALAIEAGEVSLRAQFLLGAAYRMGRHNYATRWSSPQDFDGKTLALNPALRHAPAR